jgi:hypothetical protein
MNITLEINGIDRTSSVIWNSLEKSDVLNQKVDTLKFAVEKYGNLVFEPVVGDTVELFDTGTTIYKGLILTVRKITEGHSVVRYMVDCVDNTHYLNRVLVAESYTNTTIEAIIHDLIVAYAPAFTTTNVSASIIVDSVKFNRISVSACLEKLASLSNYSWYVDYDNDIHFFEKNTEPAPFSLTDTSGNYIYESLQIAEDLSQLRNRVFIQGGEAVGDPRTELFNGDGTKKFFKLANKFSQLPTVTVGGTPKTVGVDFLDQDTDFDVLWNYNETYIKFTAAPPSGTNNIEVTGTPLYSILVQVEDATSIAEYGLSEFAKTDVTIKSKEEAFKFAVAELEAYSSKISEGSFVTYSPGLRSGQLITVNSAQRGINEDFLIQRVSFRMISQTTGEYRVELATLKTITLIDVLISQLRQNGTITTDEDNTVIQKYAQISESVSISDETVASTSHNPQIEAIAFNESFTPQSLNYAVEFVLGDVTPNGVKRQFILDGSRLA